MVTSTVIWWKAFASTAIHAICLLRPMAESLVGLMDSFDANNYVNGLNDALRTLGGTTTPRNLLQQILPRKKAPAPREVAGVGKVSKPATNTAQQPSANASTPGNVAAQSPKTKPATDATGDAIPPPPTIDQSLASKPAANDDGYTTSKPKTPSKWDVAWQQNKPVQPIVPDQPPAATKSADAASKRAVPDRSEPADSSSLTPLPEPNKLTQQEASRSAETFTPLPKPNSLPLDEPKRLVDGNNQPATSTFLPVRKPVGLNGFCPVSMITKAQLVKGSPNVRLVYGNQEYFFASIAERTKFMDDPAMFLPKFEGQCPVTRVEESKSVPGSLQYPALYRNELYLIAGKEQREKFLSDPEHYIKR